MSPDSQNDAPIISEDVCNHRNEFLERFDLEILDVAGIGDCAPLACTTSYFNKKSNLSLSESKKVSIWKCSL